MIYWQLAYGATFRRIKMRGWALIIALAILSAPIVYGTESLAGDSVKVLVYESAGMTLETMSIKDIGIWVPVLEADSSVYVRTGAGMQQCPLTGAQAVDRGLILTGDCPVGTFQQRVMLTDERDVFDVTTQLKVKDSMTVHSVEDRYEFVPPRHATVDDHTGPLDFVCAPEQK